MNNYLLELEISRLKKWQESAMAIIEQFQSNIDLSQDLWTDKDLCRHWQTSPRTTSTWREDGKIDYVKLGGKVYYTREQREEFIKRNSHDNKYQ